MDRDRTFVAMTLALGLLATSAQAQDPNKSAAVGRSVGGEEFTDESHSGDPLTAVHVRSGTSVDAIRFVYDKGDEAHGGGGGSFHGESIASDEYIGEVIVTFDDMVDSVKFIIYDKATQARKRPTERFGNDSTNSKTFKAPQGFEIYGSHGRAGSKIDQLGFLYRPLG